MPFHTHLNHPSMLEPCPAQSQRWKRGLPVGVMGFKGKQKMPSKVHSCSELTDGSKQLMEVKVEAEKEEELKKQIKDWLVLFIYHVS